MSATLSAKPWEELGISRRTYFRRKVEGQSVPTIKVAPSVVPLVATGSCPDHPNKPSDITRAQMAERLKTQSFIPNWYRIGLPCREAGLQHALESVRGNVP